MSVAETAELAVKLSLDNSQFGRGIARMNTQLGTLGSTARRVGRGIAVGLGAAGAAGAIILGKALHDGIAALKADAVVAAQTAAVIKSTGGAAGVTASQVAKLADSLSMVAGVSDDVVQGAENVILRFTHIGKDIFPAVTQAALDMAAATGTDAAGAALKLSRALDNPVKSMGALSRAGVTFTDAEEKRIKALVKSNRLGEAQALILAKVKQKFDGVAKAQADADPGRRLTVSVEKLEKALARNLLPVVQKVQERLTTFLGKPETIAMVEKLGDAIAGLFTDENLNTVASGLETAAKAVGTAISAFNKLPPEIKALAIGAFAVNKVTGGAVGGVAEAFGKLLGSGLQKIFAANVTVIGGSVSGAGGAGGVAGAAGGASKLSKALSVATIVASAVAVWETQQQVSGASTAQAQGLKATLDAGISVKTPAELQTALDGVNQGIRDLTSNPLYVLVQGDALTTLRTMQSDIEKQMQANNAPAFRQSEHEVRPSDTSGAINKLRAKLAATINAEGRAVRNGNTRNANRLEHKADALRARIASASKTADAKAAQTKTVVSSGNVLQRVANAKLAAIQHKKSTFTIKNGFTVNTSVSVASIDGKLKSTRNVRGSSTMRMTA